MKEKLVHLLEDGGALVLDESAFAAKNGSFFVLEQYNPKKDIDFWDAGALVDECARIAPLDQWEQRTREWYLELARRSLPEEMRSLF